MRALHLFFRLHRPYEIKTPENFDQGYFGGEAEFREVERTEYQPFFALIERNMQRHPNLKIALAVSGPWLEQAERWAPELIRRLRKLVEGGRVEILAMPYYHSLAAFYDRAEFAAQVELFQQRVQRLLGAECKCLCMPELIYHDKIAKWAEEREFAAVLAGDADQVLDWRSANYVYEVPGCERTRVLFQNSALSRAVRLGQRTVMVEGVKKLPDEAEVAEADEVQAEPVASRSKMTAAEFVRGMSGAKKPAQSLRVAGQKSARVETDGIWMFSAKKLQKQLEMACLRGNLVNLCLDTGIFRIYREQGVVAMFDELFASWLKTPGNRFVLPSEVVELQAPRAVVSVKTTVNWRGELPQKHEAGIVAAKDVRYSPPAWLRSEQQVRVERELYGLRTAVLSSNDEKLAADFGKMTGLDYLLLFDEQTPKLVGEQISNLTVTTLADFQAALADLRERTPILKLPEQGEQKQSSASGSDLVTTGEAEKPEDTIKQATPEEDHSVVVHRVRREEQAPTAEEPEEAEDSEEETREYVDPDELEMDEWQEAVSDAADDAEAELQIMMQRMSRAKDQESEMELEALVEAEVVTPEADQDETKGRKKKKVRKHLVIE